MHLPMSNESQTYTTKQNPARASGFFGRGRTSISILLLLVGGTVLLVSLCLPLMVGLGGYVYYQMSGRIAPGVQVGETHLGWMTVDQAAIALQEDWSTGRPLLVSDGL